MMEAITDYGCQPGNRTVHRWRRSGRPEDM